MDSKEKPRRAGRGASGVVIPLPGKATIDLCTEYQRIAQPVSFGGCFVGWLIDRQNGQVEAAAALDGSLGWFNSGQAALHALIAHAGCHG